MAFGFPASYTTCINLISSRHGARESVDGTLKALGWLHTMVSPDVFEVQMPTSGLSWGETLTVTLADEGTAVISSKCRFQFQFFDWGQNKRNVDQFASRFSVREIREAKLDQKEPVYLDDKGRTPIQRIFTDSESMVVKHLEK